MTHRYFRRGYDGKLTCENYAISVKDKGKGLGSKIFTDQVTELRKMGINRIICLAAGSAEELERNPGGVGTANGFKTWASLGYDGEIVNPRTPLPSQFVGIHRVQQLMAAPGGKEYWEKNGVAFDAEFDLTPGSRSLQILDAYVTKRKNRGQTSG